MLFFPKQNKTTQFDPLSHKHRQQKQNHEEETGQGNDKNAQLDHEGPAHVCHQEGTTDEIFFGWPEERFSSGPASTM